MRKQVGKSTIISEKLKVRIPKKLGKPSMTL